MSTDLASAPRLNEPAARGLDEITRSALATAYAAVGLTYQSESWKLLGFSTFEDWAAEQPKFRMTRAERQAKALEFTASLGMTQREAAAALGVGNGTIARDVAPSGAQPTPPFDEDPSPVAPSGAKAPVEPEEETPTDDPADPEAWRALVQVMDSIEALFSSDAAYLAATVPVRRRATTARKLRKLGTELGRIAWSLEGQGATS
jgi:hypothetical protein